MGRRQQEPGLRAAPGSAVRSAGAAGRRRDRRAERSGVSEPVDRTWSGGADGRATRRRRRNRKAPAQPAAAVAQDPGPERATFRGGYTVSVMKADVATGEAEEVWHNQPNDTLVTPSRTCGSPATHVIFPFNVGGGRGGRGARGAHGRRRAARRPARSTSGSATTRSTSRSPDSRPVLLTTTDGLIEDQTSVAVSADGKTLYYCTNAKDIERRHIWAVPVAGGTPRADHDRARASRPIRRRWRRARRWRR